LLLDAGRSGTGLLQKALFDHPESGYSSNYQNRLPIKRSGGLARFGLLRNIDGDV
jgi:hypothetical protein